MLLYTLLVEVFSDLIIYSTSTGFSKNYNVEESMDEVENREVIRRLSGLFINIVM